MFVHMPKGFHPRKQGDMGEMQAMAWLASIGAQVWIPIGHSPDVDVIAELEGRLHRVQVKSSSCQKGERFAVGLCTNGGNQSWTGAVSFFDHVRCDFLFVWLIDGRRWFIPSTAVDGKRGINLGGPKYAEYEIRADGEVPEASAGRLQCPSPIGGSAAVGEAGEPVKFVPSAEWVRIPPPPSKNGSRHLQGVRSKPTGRATISPGHQITIPIGPFTAAGLSPGDRFEVVAHKPGCVRLERIHAAGPQDPA